MNRASRPDIGLLVFRVGIAALMVGFHGWTRLNRAIGYVLFDQPWTFVDMVDRLGFPFPAMFAILSAVSESVGALLLAVGLVTRWAAAMLAINMAVALLNELFKGDPIELPGLYLLGTVTVVLLGPGQLSLDGRRRRA
jgi:putative oxidoreductase